MSTSLALILSKIQNKNPGHFSKLEANLAALDAEYTIAANAFFDKYFSYLNRNNIELDFGIDCYLHMISDMLEERLKFIREGSYSNSSFDDVEKRIYGNLEIMTYHMHGLVLAQFLWFDQYERLVFFSRNLKKHHNNIQKYLEIGGGHGLYINEAISVIPETPQFDLVDISQSSLDLAKGIVNNDKINYYLKNIFDFSDDEKYDFITMGEVLEHVEDPLSLLQKIADLLSEDGVCYITTPINAPMIDHIYLFNNEDEIRDLFRKANFEIIEEQIVISEKITEKQAAKRKVPVMYAAFIKKNKK
ncbi:MAG: class I SAM-dependent methyltransferase [Flavobacterium sp. JAD_PAG50586_2]|nr:MAG: class I SAM-dependent methyltransferase [Flavobacterium sp. JAD_PAG50586_2]